MAVQTQIQVRRGTAATWTSTNPTLAAGEWGLETDTGKYKVGTGSAVWTSLGYASILPSTVTTKGDLLAASGNATVTRQAVGSDGYTLVADSSQTTGLAWAGNQVAGKNIVINGGMDIWQRGTSSSSLGNYYTADRWYQGAWSGTGTWAQESSVVPTGSRYSAKFTASATAQPYFIQAIETANAIQLAGKTATLSAQVAASTSTAMSLTLSYSTSVDNALTGSWTDITATSGGTATPTSTTFVQLSGVYSIPSTAKSLRVVVQTSSTIANTVVIYIGQVQLELGSSATTFSRAGGTIQGELAACQRYYRRFTGVASGNGYFLIPGAHVGATSATGGYIDIDLNPTMRVAPTSITYTANAIYIRKADDTRITPLTSVSFTGANTEFSAGFSFGASGGGLTSNTFYQLQSGGTSTNYLDISAEL